MLSCVLSVKAPSIAVEVTLTTPEPLPATAVSCSPCEEPARSAPRGCEADAATDTSLGAVGIVADRVGAGDPPVHAVVDILTTTATTTSNTPHQPNLSTRPPHPH